MSSATSLEKLMMVATPWLSEIATHPNPDLSQPPLFAKTTPIKMVVSAGETLVIPCGWYHTARSLNLTISLAFDPIENLLAAYERSLGMY